MTRRHSTATAPTAAIDTSPDVFRRLFAREHVGRDAVGRQVAFMRGYGSFGADPLRTLRNWMLTPARDAAGPNGTRGTGVRNPIRRLRDAFRELLDSDPSAWTDVYRAINWLAGEFWLEVRRKGELNSVDILEDSTARLAVEAGEAVSKLVYSSSPNSDGGRKVTQREATDNLHEIQDVRTVLNDIEARLRPIAEGAAA